KQHTGSALSWLFSQSKIIIHSACRPRDVQMRLKTSVPRDVTTPPFGPTIRALQVTAAVFGSIARPCQTTVPPQSDVHVRDVVKTTLRCGRKMRPERS